MLSGHPNGGVRKKFHYMFSIRMPAMSRTEISNKVAKPAVVGGRPVGRPVTWNDLTPRERAIVSHMKDVRNEYSEFLAVQNGQLGESLPAATRVINLGTRDPRGEITLAIDIQLRPQIAEFFEFVRGIDVGVIRRLEIAEGLPVRMELQQEVSDFGGRFNG